MKRAVFLFCGICWLVFGVGFGLVLVQYLVRGAGIQEFGPVWPVFSPLVSSGSVLVGLVHVVGLCAICSVCFAIGIGLCARGLVAYPDRAEEKPEPTKQ